MIVSVIPCAKNISWDSYIDKVNGKFIEYTGEIATSTKTLETAVAATKALDIEVKTMVNPTKPFDIEVTAPATLSKRHSYTLIYGVIQTFYSQNSYFYDGNGYVKGLR